jgi:hypothetical protein
MYSTYIVLLNFKNNCWTLGFISKYILGCPIEECVSCGIDAGSYIIQQPGITKDDSFNL